MLSNQQRQIKDSIQKLGLKLKCELCGSTEKIVFHHKSYDPEVTQQLCRSCHGKIHNKKKTFVKPKNFKYKGKMNIKIEPNLMKALNDYRREQRRIPTLSNAICKLLWYALEKIKQNS